MTQYYIETDGKIYLIESEGELGFPRSKENVPFEIRQKARMVIGKEEVLYSEPLISYHPESWLNKDEVPLMDNVKPIVRKAVNFSLPRVVVEAVIRDGDRVLLVKPTRGYNKDYWTLPGGFLVYSETPEEAVEREVEEEIGVNPDVTQLLNVYSASGDENSYQWIIFYFAAEIPEGSGKVAPNHEIKQLSWFKIHAASEALHSPLMREGFDQIFLNGNDANS